jgi:GNAT superfamily N-acetyltransferase
MIPRINIEVRAVNDWPQEYIDLVCTRLTLQKGDNATADGAYSRMRAILRSSIERSPCDLFLVWHKKQAIAAGLSIPRESSRHALQVYVDQKFRRQKVGHRLIKAMILHNLRRNVDSFQVFRWNDSAELFYQKFDDTVVPLVKRKYQKENSVSI